MAITTCSYDSAARRGGSPGESPDFVSGLSRWREAPALPDPRGELSAALLAHLRRRPHPLPPLPPPTDDPLAGDESQLCLYICYELHYRAFAGVDEGWEWEPSLLAFRRQLEAGFESALADLVGPPRPSGDVEADLRRVLAGTGGRSLSGHVLERGTLDQFREFAVHRSAYQLKEADPHTWAIPRLAGRAKAALIEIQRDEYGDGVEEAMHAELFADTMRALGLDVRYGSYLDVLPGVTLATTNLVSLFGLHRRWRGALVGHLAAFEMTSVVPMGRYSRALARLGVPDSARRFYDVHVEADAHHEIVAATDLVGGLVASEPALAGDVIFGARAVTALERRFTDRLLTAWEAGTTSLLVPLRG